MIYYCDFHELLLRSASYSYYYHVLSLFSQALDVKSSQLLQIPHFNEEILKHCLKGKNATSTLSDYLQKEKEQRKARLLKGDHVGIMWKINRKSMEINGKPWKTL